MVHPTYKEKRDYFVPNFGVDKDIVDAQANIAAMEKKYGVWDVKNDRNLDEMWRLGQNASNHMMGDSGSIADSFAMVSNDIN